MMACFACKKLNELYMGRMSLLCGFKFHRPQQLAREPFKREHIFVYEKKDSKISYFLKKIIRLEYVFLTKNGLILNLILGITAEVCF